MYVPNITVESSLEVYENITEKELPSKLQELNTEGIYVEESELEKGYASEGDLKRRSYKLIGRKYKRTASCNRRDTLILTEKLASAGLSISKVLSSDEEEIKFEVKSKRTGRNYIEIEPNLASVNSSEKEESELGAADLDLGRTSHDRPNRIKRTFNRLKKIVGK